jgi:hypothetical protein
MVSCVVWRNSSAYPESDDDECQLAIALAESDELTAEIQFLPVSRQPAGPPEFNKYLV